VANWIEPAKTSRSKCVTCDKVIEKGSARLSEETRDIGIPTMIHRYYHLRCALAIVPDVLRRALEDVRGDIEIEGRSELEAKLEQLLAIAAAKREERYAAQRATPEASVWKVVLDPKTSGLVEQLQDDPHDVATLAVIADQLQTVNDPRGELIALELALAADPRAAYVDDEEDDEEDDDERPDPRDVKIKKQFARRRTLRARFALPLDPTDRCEWGIGFVRRLELVAKTHARLTGLAPVWRNPSVRLLTELQVSFASEHDSTWTPLLAEVAPASLRRLEIGRSPKQPLPGLDAVLAVLPRLETLSLVGVAGLETLVHPTLSRLELGVTGGAGGTGLAAMIHPTTPKNLPAVTELVLRLARSNDTEEVCAELAGTKWLRQLTHLSLHNLRGDALGHLESGVGKRRLERLELFETLVDDVTRRMLDRCAREVVVHA
jgi:hypothetical protein